MIYIPSQIQKFLLIYITFYLNLQKYMYLTFANTCMVNLVKFSESEQN